MRLSLFLIAFSLLTNVALTVDGEDVTTKQAGNKITPLKLSQDSARVAVAQINIQPAQLVGGKDTADALIPWIERAAKDKVDLLVLPEYILGAFHLKSPLIDKLCGLAKRHHVNIIVGGWEHYPEYEIRQPPLPGTYSNTVLAIGRNGKLAGKHRKMHAAVGPHSPYCWPPNPGEMGENTMVLGKANGVVDFDFGRVGLLTCYDGYFFESFQMPSLRGAEILVWVNGRGGMVEPHIIQAASFITCTHVVASNQSIGCGSAICSYPGWRLDQAAPEPGSEAFLVGDLDLKEIRKQRLNNRMLHQRRPEIYGPMTQSWKPWTAYPDIKPYSYDEAKQANPSK